MKLALSVPGFGQIETPKNIPSGASAPSNILQTAISLLFLGGLALALIILLYGGILWITSQGDKQKLDRARSTITYSIVGLIVMLLAFVIVQTIGYVLGIPWLQAFGVKTQPIVVPPNIP